MLRRVVLQFVMMEWKGPHSMKRAYKDMAENVGRLASMYQIEGMQPDAFVVLVRLPSEGPAKSRHGKTLDHGHRHGKNTKALGQQPGLGG